MGKLESAQQEEFSYFPIAKLVAHTPEQHLKDDVGGNFDEIEECAGSLIEGATALPTTKHGIAQTGMTL